RALGRAAGRPRCPAGTARRRRGPGGPGRAPRFGEGGRRRARRAAGRAAVAVAARRGTSSVRSILVDDTCAPAAGILTPGSPPPPAFPADASGVQAEGAPRSQWRDRAGFAPDFPAP